MRDGRIHDTGVPSPTPRPWNPAATRSHHALYSAYVSVRPCMSSASCTSGVAATRSSTSSHGLLPSVSIRGITTSTPPSVCACSCGRRSRATRSHPPGRFVGGAWLQLLLVHLAHRRERQRLHRHHDVG